MIQFVLESRYLVYVFVIFTISILLYIRNATSKSPYPLPPGPPGEPLIGHLRMVPVENPQLAYMKWGEEYSMSIFAIDEHY